MRTTSLKSALIAIVIVLTGCAAPMLMSDATKRELFEQKCVQKVQPMLKFIALFSTATEPDKKVCGCVAQRIDIERVQSAVLKSGEERDSAVAALLVENMPLLRNCARETGVLR